MLILPSPYTEDLTKCLGDIIDLEKEIEEKRSLKNEIYQKQEKFYTDQLKGKYFKMKNTNQLGQISKVYFKNGGLHLYYFLLEFTSNSKFMKKFYDFDFSDELELIKK